MISLYQYMTAEDILAERNLDCDVTHMGYIEQTVVEAYMERDLWDEDDIVEYVLRHVPNTTEHDARVLTQEFLDFSDFIGKYTTP